MASSPSPATTDSISSTPKRARDDDKAADTAIEPVHKAPRLAPAPAADAEAESDELCICGATQIGTCPDLRCADGLVNIHPLPKTRDCPCCGVKDTLSGFDGYDSDEDPDSFNVRAQEADATSFCVECNECFK